MAIKISKRWLEEYAHDIDVQVVTDYSGRFMYGQECVGIVGGPSDLAKFLLNLYDAVTDGLDDDDAIDAWDDVHLAWQDVRWDDMGRDLIFYWPSVCVEE